MANFILSYDLNGDHPTHKEMDDHLDEIGCERGRILESVWYIGHNGPLNTLFNHVVKILSNNDQVILVEAGEAAWDNLLIEDQGLQSAWRRNR